MIMEPSEHLNLAQFCEEHDIQLPTDNDEQVADCISKIGISSRFLLWLINDILDMSQIESGKCCYIKKNFLLPIYFLM